MNTFILDAVALPREPANWFLNNVNKYISENYARSSSHRSTCSLEQRNNVYLLADQPIAFDVPGDYVAIEWDEGRIARVMASVLEHHHADRTLHVYDDLGNNHSQQYHNAARTQLERNVRRSGSSNWLIHDSIRSESLSTDLPPTIAFVHLDCAFGDLPQLHSQSVLRCLNAVYPRMSPGAIGVLMDYHDPERTIGGSDRNPGVKMACDLFFETKPECIQILYGGRYSQAFFRKVW